jgi:carbonic anhydrase
MKHRLSALLVLVIAAACQSGEKLEPTSKPSKKRRYILPEHNNMGFCQSPINIQSVKTAAGTHEIHLNYKASTQRLLNKGHTIEFDYDAGSSIEIDGVTYDFKQLHFHTPSEHLIDGVTYAMEIHMVHTQRKDPSQFLVIAALFKEGPAHPFLTKLLKKIPEKKGEEVVLKQSIDVRELFDKKANSGYFQYRGSLTTPPYSETVLWIISKYIKTASAEQIKTVNRLEGNNARVIQLLHGRTIEND